MASEVVRRKNQRGKVELVESREMQVIDETEWLVFQHQKITYAKQDMLQIDMQASVDAADYSTEQIFAFFKKNLAACGESEIMAQALATRMELLVTGHNRKIADAFFRGR